MCAWCEVEDGSVWERHISDPDSTKQNKNTICTNCYIDYEFNLANAIADAQEFNGIDHYRQFNV
jgi:hypothetical protein